MCSLSIAPHARAAPTSLEEGIGAAPRFGRFAGEACPDLRHEGIYELIHLA